MFFKLEMNKELIELSNVFSSNNSRDNLSVIEQSQVYKDFDKEALFKNLKEEMKYGLNRNMNINFSSKLKNLLEDMKYDSEEYKRNNFIFERIDPRNLSSVRNSIIYLFTYCHALISYENQSKRNLEENIMKQISVGTKDKKYEMDHCNNENDSFLMCTSIYDNKETINYNEYKFTEAVIAKKSGFELEKNTLIAKNIDDTLELFKKLISDPSWVNNIYSYPKVFIMFMLRSFKVWTFSMGMLTPLGTFILLSLLTLNKYYFKYQLFIQPILDWMYYPVSEWFKQEDKRVIEKDYRNEYINQINEFILDFVKEKGNRLDTTLFIKDGKNKNVIATKPYLILPYSFWICNKTKEYRNSVILNLGSKKIKGVMSSIETLRNHGLSDEDIENIYKILGDRKKTFDLGEEEILEKHDGKNIQYFINYVVPTRIQYKNFGIFDKLLYLFTQITVDDSISVYDFDMRDIGSDKNSLKIETKRYRGETQNINIFMILFFSWLRLINNLKLNITGEFEYFKNSNVIIGLMILNYKGSPGIQGVNFLSKINLLADIHFVLFESFNIINPIVEKIDHEVIEKDLKKISQFIPIVEELKKIDPNQKSIKKQMESLKKFFMKSSNNTSKFVEFIEQMLYQSLYSPLRNNTFWQAQFFLYSNGA